MKKLGLLVAFLTTLLFSAPAWADVVAHIYLWSQTMVVSVDGVQRYRWPVSTARIGYVTPMGEYHPIRLERTWFSTIYDNAPMPYAIFFRGGYAIHGTNEASSIGRRASHGCVRLDTANAATLFALVQARGNGGTSIVITRW
jgi:lipoprotein-anchoring transpeptidase ErfK/SrfK